MAELDNAGLETDLSTRHWRTSCVWAVESVNDRQVERKPMFWTSVICA